MEPCGWTDPIEGWISHFDAFCDVQLSLADSPLVIEAGATDKPAVRAAGGGAAGAGGGSTTGAATGAGAGSTAFIAGFTPPKGIYAPTVYSTLLIVCPSIPPCVRIVVASL